MGSDVISTGGSSSNGDSHRTQPRTYIMFPHGQFVEDLLGQCVANKTFKLTSLP